MKIKLRISETAVKEVLPEVVPAAKEVMDVDSDPLLLWCLPIGSEQIGEGLFQIKQMKKAELLLCLEIVVLAGVKNVEVTKVSADEWEMKYYACE